MRSHALAALAVVLGLMPVGRRLVASLRRPALPLACAHVVEIEDADGERVACANDAALTKCARVEEGVRYRGCEAVGLVRGDLLAMHGQPIDVDRASAEDLRALPGIGAALSERIVETRESRPFCAPDDLRRVHGLGEKRIAALAPHLAFGATLCESHPAQ